jgi:hypothetical protein
MAPDRGLLCSWGRRSRSVAKLAECAAAVPGGRSVEHRPRVSKCLEDAGRVMGRNTK